MVALAISSDQAICQTRALHSALEYSRSAPPPKAGKRFAQVAAASYDADAHTVELVLSSGTDVQRYGYIERLLIDPLAVDVSRVAAAAVKVLDSHNASGVGAILGTLTATRFQNGQLIGVCKFGATSAALQAEGMVARGELTSVSIGYSVDLWRAVEVITDPSTGAEVTVWRADAWTLMEVSFVSVPADPTAGVRSANTEFGQPPSAASCGTTEGEEMQTRNAPGAPAPTNPAIATQFTAGEAIDFVEMGRSFGLADEAQRLVREQTSPTTARAALLRAAADKQRAETSTTTVAAAVLRDERETSNEGIRDALLSRLTRKEPTEHGRQFRHMSMVDMIRYQMRQRGERGVDFMSPADIVGAMHSRRGEHTTSDFPMLLQGTGNRVLMDAFASAPNPLKTLARKATIDDFRTKYSIKLGSFPTLPLVPESSEVKRLTTSESYENYKLGTYSGIFALSRQAIINDDLDAFGTWITRMAQAASETEAAQLVGLLTANSGAGPNLTDGNALFSSVHGNIAGSGSAITTDALSAARLAMRTQKNLDGKTLAPVVPQTLLVGPSKETEGEMVLSSIYAATIEDANTFAGKLSLAVEPRLSGNPWYVFSDPNQSPVLEYAYLNGAEGPKLDTKEGWEVLGTEFRAILDFGCGVVDHRGAYLNAGA